MGLPQTALSRGHICHLKASSILARLHWETGERPQPVCVCVCGVALLMSYQSKVQSPAGKRRLLNDWQGHCTTVSSVFGAYLCAESRSGLPAVAFPSFFFHFKYHPADSPLIILMASTLSPENVTVQIRRCSVAHCLGNGVHPSTSLV